MHAFDRQLLTLRTDSSHAAVGCETYAGLQQSLVCMLHVCTVFTAYTV